ncbi:MAG: CopG family transcriptional regulator [Nitrospirae bacterium]|nr:MAG: CopG family transcriptional regulator [Nitrospirota bacterium]
MQRITISLPEEEAEVLRRAARRRGVSVSALVREAISHALAPATGSGSLPFVGLGRSGTRTTGRDAEAVLAREWAGDRDR